jgi:hypothetical protein
MFLIARVLLIAQHDPAGPANFKVSFQPVEENLSQDSYHELRYPSSAVFKGAEIWINAQGEVLSVMEAAMTDWMRRRRDVMDTWSRSLQKMCECRNPVDFV